MKKSKTTVYSARLREHDGLQFDDIGLVVTSIGKGQVELEVTLPARVEAVYVPRDEVPPDKKVQH